MDHSRHSKQQQQMAMMAQVMQLMPRNDLGQLAQLAQLQQGQQTQRDNQQRLAMAQQALEENLLQGQFGRETGRADLGLRRAAGGRAEQALLETIAQNKAVNTRMGVTAGQAERRLGLLEDMAPYQQGQAGSATELQRARALKEMIMVNMMGGALQGQGQGQGGEPGINPRLLELFRSMMQDSGAPPPIQGEVPAMPYRR